MVAASIRVSHNENTGAITRRGAFSPEHRWLHNWTPATDGDKGLMAGQLLGEGPALRRLLSFCGPARTEN
jgi:hypothetical protein